MYNWRVSAVIAFLSVLFYTFLIVALQTGAIEPFVYNFYGSADSSSESYQIWLNFILLSASLSVAVYGNSIASYFNKQRERALEERNRELAALNRISSTIRSVINMDRMVNEELPA